MTHAQWAGACRFSSGDADGYVGSAKGVYSCYGIQIQCVDTKEGNLRRRNAHSHCCMPPPPPPPLPPQMVYQILLKVPLSDKAHAVMDSSWLQYLRLCNIELFVILNYWW